MRKPALIYLLSIILLSIGGGMVAWWLRIVVMEEVIRCS